MPSRRNPIRRKSNVIRNKKQQARARFRKRLNSKPKLVPVVQLSVHAAQLELVRLEYFGHQGILPKDMQERLKALKRRFPNFKAVDAGKNILDDFERIRNSGRLE
ncbi:MAG: hypothetical protein Q7S21_07110 [archaeon]|nr:hypothetical protein [archaeon]